MQIARSRRYSKDLRLGERIWWSDVDTECRLVLSQPAVDPELWAEYGSGALRSYRRHGVECALDRAALDSGDDTVMFFVALDADERVVAGVRAIGPLGCAEDTHAISEWQDQPGQDAVRKMITDRIPYGVLEMKSAWVSDKHPHNQQLTDAIARSGFHMMAVLNVQFHMATAAAYVLNRWRSSGGIIAPIPATPYPDARYQTKLIWWDRRTFIHHAQPHQAAKVLTETQAIRNYLAPAAVSLAEP